MSTGDWTERFQGTRALPRGVRDRLLKVAQIRNYPKGQEVFGPRNIPDSLLFLLEGTIRVSQTSENGRDIVLYRVDAGESCVLTTACMLAEEAYNAEGLAESEISVVVLPRPAFDALVADEAAFRNFVFAAYSRRLIDLLRVVDDVAFGRVAAISLSPPTRARRRSASRTSIRPNETSSTTRRRSISRRE